MNSGYEQPVRPTVFVIYGPNMSSNIIKLYMEQSLDEEIMTIRSWRLSMNSGYEQPAGPTVFVISRPNMSSNIIKLYMDGFYT